MIIPISLMKSRDPERFRNLSKDTQQRRARVTFLRVVCLPGHTAYGALSNWALQLQPSERTRAFSAP